MRLLVFIFPLIALAGCTRKDGPTAGTGDPIQYPWSMDFKPDGDAGFDSLQRDATLRVEAQGEATGKINHFDASILGNRLTLRNTMSPSLRVIAALGADGRFSFPAADLLGDMYGPVPVEIHMAPKSGYRAVPDTLQLILLRALKRDWSLDLDFGDASIKARRTDTGLTSDLPGDIAGKVNGFDPALFQDTLFFRILEYSEIRLDVHLGADGAFSFPPADLVFGLDGIFTVYIFLKGKTARHRPVPDTLLLNLVRP